MAKRVRYYLTAKATDPMTHVSQRGMWASFDWRSLDKRMYLLAERIEGEGLKAKLKITKGIHGNVVDAYKTNDMEEE